MERQAARIGSRSGGLAPTPSRPSRITKGAALPRYASAAIRSCAADNSSATSAQSSRRVMPRSVAPLTDVVPKISGGRRRKLSSFLRISSLQSSCLKASRTSIFHPRCRNTSAATSASPALWPFPANTMHLPGFAKNFVTARATPAPAWSMSASTCTPLANAASSAARICAEVKIGRSKSALPVC